MIRVLIFSSLVLSLGLSQPIQAQSSAAVHQHETAAMIDGAKHPELIPDSTAYRLYFVAMATDQNASESDRKRQKAHMAKTGLSANEQEVLVIALSDFRRQYDELVRQYNEEARRALARNEMADVGRLLRALDGLVEATRSTLRAQLPADSAARFHAFIQFEKRNMKIHAEDK